MDSSIIVRELEKATGKASLLRQRAEEADAKIAAMTRAANTVRIWLEIGDARMMESSDGHPVHGKLPELSPEEWGKVYRACQRIVKLGDKR